MPIPENDTQLWKGFDGHGLYAKRAELDRDGNPIVSTYARKTDVPALTDSLTTSTTTAVTPSAVKSAIDAIVKIPATANQPSTLCVTGQAPGWTGWENEQVDVPYVTEKIAGRKYRIVQIGNQWWMAENLDYKIPGVTFNPRSDIGERAGQMYYNWNSDYSLDGTYKLGMLYNGPSVAFSLPGTLPTIAPGWHIATKSDWTTLMSTIGGNNQVAKLKTVDGNITQDFPASWNGTDEYDFNLLPAGCGERKYSSAPGFSGLGTMIRYRLGSGSGYNTDTVTVNRTTYSTSNTTSYSYYGYVRLVKNIS
jgi:uncharacterized protein (TIGR02145 family)